MTQRNADLLPEHVSLPDERKSVTHKFTIDGFEGYLTVGLYDDGKPGELFIKSGKEGTTLGGILHAFAISISMGLQRGIPLDDYVSKFKHMRFEPDGFTGNPEIRFASSVMDYIFRWLELKFGDVRTDKENTESRSTKPSNELEKSVEEERPSYGGNGQDTHNSSPKRPQHSSSEPNQSGYAISCSAANGRR